MVSTSTPQNEAELQLYRVLQRASLLAYYDTLLEMGKLLLEKEQIFNDKIEVLKQICRSNM